MIVLPITNVTSSSLDEGNRYWNYNFGFAVSRRAKTSVNDSDRLTKFLARFGLKFKEIAHD